MTATMILETNIIHASDVIYWMDGSTADDEEIMQRLSQPLAVQLTDRPADLQILQGNGKTAFWRRTDGTMVNGLADETDKAFPVTAAYSLAGCVEDSKGYYNPRNFSITAGGAAGHRIVLYPSPFGTRFSKAGGLTGTLRWSATETQVPWAILTLQVTTSLDTTMVFRAQADARGDFLLPLKRLPPMPEGVTHYDAELALTAPGPAATTEPLNPADDLTAALLGSPESVETFTAAINLEIVFGEIRSIHTLNKDFLSVQPS
jgi:hypothetical protein